MVYSLTPKPLNPKPLNPKTLNPKTLNPKPLIPKPLQKAGPSLGKHYSSLLAVASELVRLGSCCFGGLGGFGFRGFRVEGSETLGLGFSV